MYIKAVLKCPPQQKGSFKLEKSTQNGLNDLHEWERGYKVRLAL